MCALPQLGVWCSVSLAAWCKTLSSQDLKILTLNVCLIWAVSVTSELVTRIWNEFFTPVRHRSELQTPHGSSTVTCRFFECWPRNSTGTCSKCQANNTLLSAGVQLWHPLSLSHECKFLCRVDFQILSRANLGVFILPLFFCFPWCSCAQSQHRCWHLHWKCVLSFGWLHWSRKGVQISDQQPETGGPGAISTSVGWGAARTVAWVWAKDIKVVVLFPAI